MLLILGSGGGGGLVPIQLGVLLLAALLLGQLARRCRLPAVLGEIAAGLLLGPGLLGGVGPGGGLFPDGAPPELGVLAMLAALVLLFDAGLETELKLLLRYLGVGGAVGIGGLLVSFLGCWAVAAFGHAWLTGGPLVWNRPVVLMLGMIGTGTSVSLSARVLADRRKLDAPEGVTILSAAVIDDVLGIIGLALVVGWLEGAGQVSWGELGWLAGRVLALWLGATALGLFLAHRISRVLKRLGDVAVLALGLALVVGGLFEQAGLAMIIGAYVAGLSLARSDLRHLLREQLLTVRRLLVPLFFAHAGQQIPLGSLKDPQVLGIGLLFAVTAFAAKVIGCGLPAWATRFNLRGALRVGFGMAPRCEVALVMAGVGLSAGYVDEQALALVVMMVFVNALCGPLGLALSFASSAPGTRGPALGNDGGQRFAIELPTEETADFFRQKLIDAFVAEGFFVHVLEGGDLVEMLHDARMIELRREQATLVFSCDAIGEGLVREAFQEARAALENTLARLERPATLPPAAVSAAPPFELSRYIVPEQVAYRLRAGDRDAAIDELLALLARAGRVDDVAAAREAVLARERRLSTLLPGGLAVPHGRTAAVPGLVCAIGLAPDGVAFGTGGEPASIIILTLIPAAGHAPSLQLQAALHARLDEDGRRRLLAARSSRGACAVLLGDERGGK